MARRPHSVCCSSILSPVDILSLLWARIPVSPLLRCSWRWPIPSPSSVPRSFSRRVLHPPLRHPLERSLVASYPSFPCLPRHVDDLPIHPFTAGMPQPWPPPARSRRSLLLGAAAGVVIAGVAHGRYGTVNIGSFDDLPMRTTPGPHGACRAVHYFPFGLTQSCPLEVMESSSLNLALSRADAHLKKPFPSLRVEDRQKMTMRCG